MSELYPLQDFTPDECATYSRIMCAEPAPESYVRQHVSEETCWCGPIQVGTLGVWTHQMGDTQ
jgi:hypothetical protein